MASSSAVTVTVPEEMTRPSWAPMPSLAFPVTVSEPSPAIVRSAAEYSAALASPVPSPYDEPSVRAFVEPSARMTTASSAAITAMADVVDEVIVASSRTRRTSPVVEVSTTTCPARVPESR